MISLKNLKLLFLAVLSLIFLNACNGKLPGGDARKSPPDPAKRVAKNIEEGRGFRIMDKVAGGGSGKFEFASSNPLWRASLDTIDFMPLTSVNYSGGIIITDWYSTDNNNESIKISIRFLTNEIRSDALDIKVFNRNCKTPTNCIISEKSKNLIPELNAKILKTAAVYEKQIKDKDFKPYKGSTSK
ncbi:DUF3576 domain-containing protein [Pelagibacteraceae bacterium]|nr:DUF3576 domain-containing protein [Pelagibacteraceae bacterium]